MHSYELKKLKTVPQHPDRSQAKVKKKKNPEDELLTLSLLPLVNIWWWFSRTKNLLFWTCCHWVISTNTEQREGFCVRQSLRLLRGLAARGMCGTDSLQTQLLPRFFSPNAFLPPRANPLIHWAKSCSLGFLCDIHCIKVTRRRNQISVVHGMEKKERVLCLWLSDAALLCLPTPQVPHIPGLQVCAPAPGSCCVQLPSCLCWHCPLALCGWRNRFLLYHTNVLWVCGADAAWHWLAEFWLSPK